MQVMFSLFTYQLRVYLRTSKAIMPLCALIVFLGGLYAVAPFRVADSFAFSMSILPFIMAWVGFAACEVEDAVSEQLLVLKARSAAKYYISVTLFLLCISTAFSLIAVLFPWALQLIRGAEMFKTPLTPGAMAYALVLHTAAAFMGSANGALFHPRLVHDRRSGVLFVLGIMLIGFTAPGIVRLFPFAGFVIWLFPPVSRASTLLAGQDYFTAGVAATLFLQYILYGTVFSALRIVLLIKRKFG